MKKFLIIAGIIFLIFSVFITIPVFAASSDFLQKASEYYQKNCKENSSRIPPSRAILCYLFDKVQEHDQSFQNIAEEQNNQAQDLESLKASASANLAEINLIKEKRILAYGQFRGAVFTTTSNIDVPTDAQVEITCPIQCVLLINYVVDTRNNQTGAHNIYTIYLDGLNLSFTNQASYAFPNQAIPISLTGIYPASAGTHTVQIYAHTNAGEIMEHTKTLTVFAIGQ